MATFGGDDHGSYTPLAEDSPAPAPLAGMRPSVSLWRAVQFAHASANESGLTKSDSIKEHMFITH